MASCILNRGRLRENLQSASVRCEVVEVGQLHVVAKLRGEHAVAVARYGELQPLERVGRQREDVALVVDDVEGYAVIVRECLPPGDAADEAQKGECQVFVDPGDGANLPHRPFLVLARAENLEAMRLQGLGQQVGPHPLAVEGEEVDEDASLAEDAVVVALVEKRVAVAQLGEEVEVVRIGVVALQGDVVGQLRGQ